VAQLLIVGEQVAARDFSPEGSSEHWRLSK
jgi:hypothetical protein